MATKLQTVVAHGEARSDSSLRAFDKFVLLMDFRKNVLDIQHRSVHETPLIMFSPKGLRLLNLFFFSCYKINKVIKKCIKHKLQNCKENCCHCIATTCCTVPLLQFSTQNVHFTSPFLHLRIFQEVKRKDYTRHRTTTRCGGHYRMLTLPLFAQWG